MFWVWIPLMVCAFLGAFFIGMAVMRDPGFAAYRRRELKAQEEMERKEQELEAKALRRSQKIQDEMDWVPTPFQSWDDNPYKEKK